MFNWVQVRHLWWECHPKELSLFSMFLNKKCNWSFIISIFFDK
uniref:Uncharacterized protein n=1 Tax=Anguilla anguilla TaxID=7936 RepID=A0A0E9P5C4_ANGAN